METALSTSRDNNQMTPQPFSYDHVIQRRLAGRPVKTGQPPADQQSTVVNISEPCLRCAVLGQRIQFSSPLRFLGGPGMLSSTSLASDDFFSITSFSRSAVCMRRTLDWFLRNRRIIAVKSDRKTINPDAEWQVDG